MDPEDGIELLLKSAYPQSRLDEAEPQKRGLAGSIAAELGYLAIALDQAGATIRRNIYTLEKYLHSYLGYRHRLLSSPSQFPTIEANVITTWEIPFRQIEKRNSIEYRDAVTLMHIFAFLHFESISEEIFYASWISVETVDDRLPELLRLDSKYSEIAQARLRLAISVLCDYSIIDYDSDRGVCALHPVVHRWARTRLAEKDQATFWLDCTVQLLTRCISPHLEVSGRHFRRSLLPHIDSCIELLQSNNPNFPGSTKVANHLERFASLYADNGKWRLALRLQRQVANYRARCLGKAHEDTLRIQRGVSSSLWNLFQVKDAIDVQQRLLWTRWWYRHSFREWTTLWKPDHIDYCIALDDLTQSLWLAGLRHLSKRTGERAVAGFLKRLGPDDPSTLNAMFNLGRTYHHLGEFEKSHKLLVSVLKKRRLFFGPNHPETLMARNELGMCFYAQKSHLAAAERLVAGVMKARRQILGEEHAYTLWSINDLSKILCERGRAAEAVARLESLIPVVERTLGPDHVGMNMTKGNLARAYVRCQKWSDAEAMLSQMLDIINDEHPDWIETMCGYVHVQIQLAKFSQAEDNCRNMLQKLVKSKGGGSDSLQRRKVMELQDQITSRTTRSGSSQQE